MALLSDKPLRPKQRAFLRAFSISGKVVDAAEVAGVHRTVPYTWQRESKEFAEAFAVAEEQAARNLEDEAYRRAHDGVRKPVLYQGAPVKIDGEILYEHEYSDSLLMFLLKGLRPERYRDRSSIEHTGKEGAPIELNVSATETLARRIAGLAERKG